MNGQILDDNEKNLYDQYRTDMQFESESDYVSFEDWKLMKSGESITEYDSSKILLK